MFLLITLLQPQGLRSTLSVVHSLLHCLPWRAWVWPRENSPDWDKGAQKSPQECLIRMGFADFLYRHMQYSSLNSLFGLRSLHVRHWRSGFREPFSLNGTEPLPLAAKCMQRTRWFQSHFPKRKGWIKSFLEGPNSKWPPVQTEESLIGVSVLLCAHSFNLGITKWY